MTLTMRIAVLIAILDRSPAGLFITVVVIMCIWSLFNAIALDAGDGDPISKRTWIITGMLLVALVIWGVADLYINPIILPAEVAS